MDLLGPRNIAISAGRILLLARLTAFAAIAFLLALTAFFTGLTTVNGMFDLKEVPNTYCSGSSDSFSQAVRI